jgi:predicted metal-dependent hydrolase
MQLNYHIIETNRKTIGIFVERDKRIVVRVPINTPQAKVDKILESKKSWLFNKLNHPSKYSEHPTKKEVVAGESLLYLGKVYPLRITKTDVKNIVFDQEFVLAEKNRSRARALFTKWYKEQASLVFLPKVQNFANSLGVPFKEMRLSRLHRKWGSCTKEGIINLNWRLVKAPSFVIDYVIVHELAHILLSGHSEEFWNVVAIQCPNYKKAIAWLKSNGERIEADFP